ncbi:MAG: hypothetical protein ACLTL8_07275 [Bifidobacterium pseudocatenulatum]
MTLPMACATTAPLTKPLKTKPTSTTASKLAGGHRQLRRRLLPACTTTAITGTLFVSYAALQQTGGYQIRMNSAPKTSPARMLTKPATPRSPPQTIGNNWHGETGDAPR